MLLLALFSVAVAQAAPDEAAVRAALAKKSAVLQLPAGRIEISSELRIPAGMTVRGNPSGTVLRASSRFRGRALLICGSRVTLEKLTIEGNRENLSRPAGIPPYDRSFSGFYTNNGILAEAVDGLTIRDVALTGIPGLAVVISASRRVTLEGISVSSSGSLNAKGRNNTTGGILLEEGTSDFAVRNCTFRAIRGNGVWTHSRYTSPRNARGVITGNHFREIGRDAIQVGHATEVRVEDNTGERIGYPVSEVDVEGGGTPVGIDTAGNVDKSSYSQNRFSDINGKCIDLDGFHDGEVRGNVCTNAPGTEYVFGHYGIVFNNTNPDMQSRNIQVTGNVIDGTKFGGIFVIGSGHTIRGNRLLHLNLAGCNESAARFGCIYDPKQPDLLRSGIYLGAKAERPDLARNNTITDNIITGHGMSERCVAAAPEVSLETQTIRNNTCKDQ